MFTGLFTLYFASKYLQIQASSPGNDHIMWIYAAFALVLTFCGWLGIQYNILSGRLITLEAKADRWEDVKQELTKINRKLDMFLRQEIDTLKDIAAGIRKKDN